MGVSRPLEERFWEKVKRPPWTDCWLWSGSTAYKGYGEIWSNGRLRRATQVSWEIHHGKPFPIGKMACHTCDNPQCVNPAHLWPGTMSENIRDAMQKGRYTPNPITGVRQEKCKRGHDLSDGYKVKNGGRQCRVCTAEFGRQRYAKKKLLAAMGKVDSAALSQLPGVEKDVEKK